MYLKELFKKSIANKTLDKNAFIKMCNNLNIPINKKQKGWFKRAFYELVEVLKEISFVPQLPPPIKLNIEELILKMVGY